MFVLWSTLAGLAVWLEVVYHIGGFGLTSVNPVYGLWLIVSWSGIWSLLIGVIRGKLKKWVYYTAIWLPVIWTSAQFVYLRIFRQPLLWTALLLGSGDALNSYWREALDGVFRALPVILLFVLPAAVIPALLKKRGWELPAFHSLQITGMMALVLAGIVGSVAVLEVGRIEGLDYYGEYHEFYDPLIVAENMGVLAVFHGDTVVRLRFLTEELFPRQWSKEQDYIPAAARGIVSGEGSETLTKSAGEQVSGGDILSKREPEEVSPEDDQNGNSSEKQSLAEDAPEEPVIRPQQFDIDFDLLHRLADNEHQAWLADYIESETPVNTNEYTGMFEGYNLIFLTAEGFSTYAVDEELTPTLYRLANSGFVFTNYYVPDWSTSTSDGEYINLTGLIPDQQFSMRRSAANREPYALPGFFAGENVYSYAYHNNSLSYYQRHESHPNLGYDFKACLLGRLSEEEWGDQLFEMEEADKWPASDYNMMAATVPEYVGEERFHVYYMTVSGHMNYRFSSNAMSAKNREAVEELELSEGPRAYLACNIELDKAMEYLLSQLEEAGQLERTVICLSADHYPYGLTDAEYQELAGKDLSAGEDKLRNTLILWNAGLEEPICIDKACGPMDILPTLLNLFGFEYDSRMYAGRDILSDREGMVIFKNRDFVTDSVIFIEKGDVAVWLSDEEGNDIVPDDQKEAYLAAARQEVRDRCNFSAYVLQEDYYADVEQAVK